MSMPKRKATWTLLIFNVVMLVLVIAVLASGSGSNCSSLYNSNCNIDQAVSTGLGTTFLFFLWFIGFIVIGIVALITKPVKRVCPACGREVNVGLTSCQACGFNMLGQAAAPPPGYYQPPPPPPAPPGI